MTAFATNGKPEFVMVGINRPDGRCMLYASRELPQQHLKWGIAEDRYGTATGWHIDAELRQVLVVTEPTWGQAFGKLFELWENRDRNAAIEAAEQANAELNRLEGHGAVVASYHFTEGGSKHAGLEAGCKLCHPVDFVALAGVRIDPDEKAPERTAAPTAAQLAVVEARLARLQDGQPWASPDADVLGDVQHAMSDNDPVVTKTGKVLTEADLDALADEAERGYDPEQALRDEAGE